MKVILTIVVRLHRAELYSAAHRSWRKQLLVTCTCQQQITQGQMVRKVKIEEARYLGQRRPIEINDRLAKWIKTHVGRTGEEYTYTDGVKEYTLVHKTTQGR